MATKENTMRSRADCTVRALVAVTGLDYAVAETVGTAAGRKLGRGFRSASIVAQCQRMGFKFRKLRFTRKRTLERFIREYPKGRYYVQMAHHAFAVIDGAASEAHLSLGVRVRAAWQLISPPQTAQEPITRKPAVRSAAASLAMREARYERVCKRIEVWERRAKRAEKAIKKLRRQRAYYERTMPALVSSNATVH